MSEPYSGRCEDCGRQIERGYESVFLTESEGTQGRSLCLECFNQHMAAHANIDFEHPHFPSLQLTDPQGKEHRFDFVARLLGDEVAVESYENGVDYGYEFQISGNHRDVQELFDRLLGRIRRALTRQHLVEHGGVMTVSDDRAVRGRFAWDDDSDGKLPLLVIDGSPVTWTQFGRILSHYEGWQFRLEIADPSDEV